MIRIESVTKLYASGDATIKALDDVSIFVEKGELVVVGGPSGCGKTTLLLTAGGLLHPEKGKVWIDGQDIYRLSPEEMAGFRAGNIGFVFQQYHLIPYLTVFENVNIPALAHGKDASAARAEQLIDDLGLRNRMHHTPSELSAGEKQRTALARALLYDPKVILADEITGNLDQKNARIVLEKLKTFTKSGGTVLLVTHDEKAFAYADRIIEMKNNKLKV
jgi:putative ABC transport system ATP-binding protein